jgi:histidinol-phosphatase
VSDADLSQAVETARAAAEAGGAAALVHWGKELSVELKRDRSPVTQADRAAEGAILRVIRNAFPHHSILSEESGAHDGTDEWRWIVDPLDGTRGFLRGGPYWGPLVALEHRGEVVVGAMALPVAKQLYWSGKGFGAYRNGERLKLSSTEDWGAATLSIGVLSRLLASPWRDGVGELIRSAYDVRCYGDVGGVAMLLNGKADAWLEGGVKVWDLSAVKILVEEAGGAFTDLSGVPTAESGYALASNTALHARALALIAERTV